MYLAFAIYVGDQEGPLGSWLQVSPSLAVSVILSKQLARFLPPSLSSFSNKII